VSGCAQQVQRREELKGDLLLLKISHSNTVSRAVGDIRELKKKE